MPVPKDLDPASWHRHFAMEANNRAWQLAEQPARTEAENREMLGLAHASAWHWSAVGTELHHMRATMLLAQVLALTGDGAGAFGLATQMRDYFVARDDTPDWELAFTHAIFANAAHVAGRAEAHAKAYGDASIAMAAIADPADRDVVLKTFNQVPPPA